MAFGKHRVSIVADFANAQCLRINSQLVVVALKLAGFGIGDLGHQALYNLRCRHFETENSYPLGLQDGDIIGN